MKLREKIQQLSSSKDAFDKYVQQLRVLSMLRKEKNSKWTQTLSNMGLISEWIEAISKDEVLMRSFWLQEMKKDKKLVERLEQEKARLKAEGSYNKAVQMAEKCVAKGISVEETAEMTELPIEEVKAIAARMGK